MKDYVFIGNRSNVLKKMIYLECSIVKIFAVENSYLEKELHELNLTYTKINNKNNLIKGIERLNFDCLVSNGCPYILPVSDIQKENQLFINIHPSLLPDLKGKHPINGSLLYDRKHGVTCHHMNDEIDSGAIIARIEIPTDNNIDLNLLYQLSFFAEGEVFEKAFRKNFKIKENIQSGIKPIYYTRKKEDLLISNNDSLKVILNKIRAFGIPSLCARFDRNGEVFKILSVKVIKSNKINKLFKNYSSDRILFIFDKSVVVKYNACIIQFILYETYNLKVGESFFGFIPRGENG